ncbi:MAG: hypothetical protein M3521_15290 [Acidobacteriota bacterium]|nr:hypothetical protein [Acidobacteriota bacterium]
MGLFDLFKAKKKADLDAGRREFLHSKGRITDGTILDIERSEAGEEIIIYYYTVQGVDFESSEILTDRQRDNALKYAPGAKVGVKFDPKNHGNSMLV